jgi:TolA-binding protein
MSFDFLTRRDPAVRSFALAVTAVVLAVPAAGQPVAEDRSVGMTGPDAAAAAQAPTTAPLSADTLPAQTTRPLDLLKAAPRVQFARDGVPVAVTPTPAPADSGDETAEPPESAMPLDPRRPSHAGVTADEPPAQPDEPQAQARRRPGFVRGILRSVPLIGPVIVRDKPEARPRRFEEPLSGPSQPASPSDATDLSRDTDAFPVPPAERPVLFPPPPSRAEMEGDDAATTGSASDGSPLGHPKQPAAEGAAPAPAPPLGEDTTSSAAIAPGTPRMAPPMPATGLTTGTRAPLFFEPNDLALPHPAAEENEVLRDEYAAAVVRAREGDHAGAAALLRDYAAAHMLSRLAPRALFLAAIMDPDPARAAHSRDWLERDFPSSPYVTELRARMEAGRVAALVAPAATSGAIPGQSVALPDSGLPTTGTVGPSPVSPGETDAEAVARLERFLASAPVGPQTLRQRLDLCRLYLKMKQPHRAGALLGTLIADARGRAEEPEALDVLAEYDIAAGRMDEAQRRLDALIAGFPAYPAMAKARLNMGLVSEAAGNYRRALAEYRAVAAGWPASAEAALARERIRDVEALVE